jgi:putative phosphoserine phosphatase/1-acylglycerol-3-phosphate O-acyltransferase
VFNRLVSIYIYGLFIFLMVLALITAGAFALAVWVFRGDPRWAFQLVVRFFWRLFLHLSPLIGSVRIINPQNLNALRPAVYVASHQSSIDFVLLGSMIENFVTISNHPISDLALFFKVPRLVGVYYMEKNNPSAAIEVFNRLSRALERGISVFIFPEGTRNFDKTLRPFQKGAFRMAQQSGVPVVPVIIHGTGKIVTKGSNVAKTLRRTDIDVAYLDPVYAKEGESTRAFIQRVRERMQHEVSKNFACQK